MRVQAPFPAERQGQSIDLHIMDGSQGANNEPVLFHQSRRRQTKELLYLQKSFAVRITVQRGAPRGHRKAVG